MRKSREFGLFKDVPDELWNDWHWQVKNRVETVEDLKKYMTLTAEEEEGVAKCLSTLRMAVTPYYLSLIDPTDPEDPVRKQAIPTEKELHRSAADLEDPLHEDTDSPAPGLTPLSGPCSVPCNRSVLHVLPPLYKKTFRRTERWFRTD